MDNFDLKKYLVENKLTSNNRVDEAETGKGQLLRFYRLSDPDRGYGDAGTVGFVRMVSPEYWEDDSVVGKGFQKIGQVLGVDPYYMGMQRYTEAEHMEEVKALEAKLEKIKNIKEI